MLSILLACAPAAAAEEWSYRVRPGDTLWDLAGDYLKPGIAWQKLQAHNGIADPYQLPPGTTLRFPLAWLHLQPARAKVVAVRGEASVSGVDAAGPVTAGMEFGIGAVLRTAGDATLSLQFADGSRLLLQGGSELRLDRLSRYGKSGMVDTRLRLQRGRITNEVVRKRGGSPAFIVDTPNSTSAVRGTRFRVNAGEAQTQTEVTEGTVAVNAGKRSANVGRGQGTVASNAQPGALRSVALLPAPDLSGIPASFNGARATPTWTPIAGAQRYRVQASDTATFDTLVVDAETSDTRLDLPVLQPGNYFLRIRGIDAQGLEGRDALAQFTAEAFPEAPFVIAPGADSKVREDRPEFSWAQVADAARYRFELSADPAFGELIATQYEKSTSLRATQALAAGRYHWRVAAEAGNGRAGPYSDAVTFTVQPLQEAGPVESQTGGTRGVTFRWRAGVPGQRYRFQLSRKPDFAKMRVDEIVSEPSITLPRLPAGTWYLRAQAIAEDGYAAAMPPAQQVKVPCGVCKVVAGGGVLWLLLAL
jgi:hypothetical protein